MSKIKIDVKDGVYLHGTGNFFTVELGQVENEKTGEIKHAIKSVGINSKDQECERIVVLCDEHKEEIFIFARLLYESEYLGEL